MAKRIVLAVFTISLLALKAHQLESRVQTIVYRNNLDKTFQFPCSTTCSVKTRPLGAPIED
jgi:hypothetical protein